MSKHRRAQITLLPVSPLLMTESEDEFDRIRDAFDQELKPRVIVEQMYVSEIVLPCLGNSAAAALQGGHHQFRVASCLEGNSRAAFAKIRRTCL